MRRGSRLLGAVLGTSVLVILLATAAILPEPAFDLPRVLAPPGPGLWAGADAFGRPVTALVARACALSLALAAGSVALALLTALALGPASALAPGLAGRALRGLIDFLLAFPSLLFALLWAAARGPGWGTLTLALWIGTFPPAARLLAARSREVVLEPHFEAARALGAGSFRLYRSHLLPFLSELLRAKGPGLLATALLAEATLTFLGVGAPVGAETWGSLLTQAKEYLIEAPHLAWATGLPLAVLVLGLQLLAEDQ